MEGPCETGEIAKIIIFWAKRLHASKAAAAMHARTKTNRKPTLRGYAPSSDIVHHVFSPYKHSPVARGGGMCVPLYMPNEENMILY